jgi:hypothetical protein
MLKTKKVLTISVDVSDLTELEIEELQYAMEVQCEDSGGTADDQVSFDAQILNSAVSDITYDEDDSDDEQGGSYETH